MSDKQRRDRRNDPKLLHYLASQSATIEQGPGVLANALRIADAQPPPSEIKEWRSGPVADCMVGLRLEWRTELVDGAGVKLEVRVINPTESHVSGLELELVLPEGEARLEGAPVAGKLGAQSSTYTAYHLFAHQPPPMPPSEAEAEAAAGSASIDTDLGYTCWFRVHFTSTEVVEADLIELEGGQGQPQADDKNVTLESSLGLRETKFAGHPCLRLLSTELNEFEDGSEFTTRTMKSSVQSRRWVAPLTIPIHSFLRSMPVPSLSSLPPLWSTCSSECTLKVYSSSRDPVDSAEIAEALGLERLPAKPLSKVQEIVGEVPEEEEDDMGCGDCAHWAMVRIIGLPTTHTAIIFLCSYFKSSLDLPHVGWVAVRSQDEGVCRAIACALHHHYASDQRSLAPPPSAVQNPMRREGGEAAPTPRPLAQPVPQPPSPKKCKDAESPAEEPPVNSPSQTHGGGGP